MIDACLFVIGRLCDQLGPGQEIACSCFGRGAIPGLRRRATRVQPPLHSAAGSKLENRHVRPLCLHDVVRLSSSAGTSATNRFTYVCTHVSACVSGPKRCLPSASTPPRTLNPPPMYNLELRCPSTSQSSSPSPSPLERSGRRAKSYAPGGGGGRRGCGGCWHVPP